MPRQSRIFSDSELPRPTDSPLGAELVSSALKLGSGPVSPAQKRFNQLLSQTEALACKIEATRTLADAHRLVHARTLAAQLAGEGDEAMRALYAAHNEMSLEDEEKAAATATAQTEDATGALRTIYHQLVSALHPDRETDPQEQLRKTALMKEANAA
jgi:hypothetical protein